MNSLLAEDNEKFGLIFVCYLLIGNHNRRLWSWSFSIFLGDIRNTKLLINYSFYKYFIFFVIMQNVEHASSIYPGISSLSFLMSCLTYHHYYISVCLIFHNILGYQKGYMVLLSENLSIEIHLVNPSNLLFFRVVEEDTRKPPCFGYTLLCYLSHSHIIAAISAFTLPFSWSSINLL